MELIKKWWKNRWTRNAVYLALLGTLFFTDVGQWVRIKMTSLTLSDPTNELGNIEEVKSVYDFPFQIMDADGDTFMLGERRGKPMFINFWASWCVPCLAEFSSLEEFQTHFSDVEFMYISAESIEDFEQYVQKTPHELPFYRQMSKVPTQLRHGAIPASYLIDAEGNVIFQHIGAADWDDDETIFEIKALLE